MAKQGGLRRWFAEEWVDIGSKKKKGKYQPCGRKSAKGSKRKYPKCVPKLPKHVRNQIGYLKNGGGVHSFIARGCGKVMNDRRKKTKMRIR